MATLLESIMQLRGMTDTIDGTGFYDGKLTLTAPQWGGVPFD